MKYPPREGWENLRLDIEDVALHFPNGHTNIGILLGASGLADIDLDCPEALTLADHFLPETACVFGRRSAPRSHRLYTAREGAQSEFRYEEFTDPIARESNTSNDGAKYRPTIVELRAGETKGKDPKEHQTVFPPSKHPDGEQVEWATYGDPAEVEPSDLRQAVAKLAAAVLLARYWSQVPRNYAAMALAGGLLRTGWSEEETTNFIWAVATAANGEELSNRTTVVNYTSQALNDRHPTTGWPRLSEYFGEPLVSSVRRWLDVGADNQPQNEHEGTRASERKSQATQLVDLILATDAELWHTPDHEPYATITVRTHKEHHPLKSGAFKRWLAALYFEETGRAASSQALQNALGALGGMAQFKGSAHPVYVRIAGTDGEIFLDLANEEWQAIKISALGWEVIDNPPVRFKRSRSMLPLPMPVRGGSLETLREFVNVRTDDAFTLLLSFLVTVFRPQGPYPVLITAGEQGTGKTGIARIIKSLTDPSLAPLRSAPRTGQDLMIAATNSRVLAFDNLSQIQDWLSDALCRLSTGGGYQARELYSDADEVILDAQCPVVLTSIEEIATRGDLLDRSLLLPLEPIEETKRLPESLLWERFEAARPAILGCLLDGVSAATRNLPTVKLDRLPRMADYALWATAAESGFGFRPGAFMHAYMGNRVDANRIALDTSLVAEKLISFIETLQGEEWIGTASMLLEELQSVLSDAQKKQQDWPKTPQALGGILRRLAPNLRQIGIDLDFKPRKISGKSARSIRIGKGAQRSVNHRQPVNPNGGNEAEVDSGVVRIDDDSTSSYGAVDGNSRTVDEVDDGFHGFSTTCEDQEGSDVEYS